jgi:hypothetical protein
MTNREAPWRCPYCTRRDLRPCPHSPDSWQRETRGAPQPEQALEVVAEVREGATQLPPLEPAQTGVGAWCTPGPANEQQRKWVIWFWDRDRGVAIYNDEGDARHAFARAEALGWNCDLLATCPRADTSATASVAGLSAAAPAVVISDALLAELDGISDHPKLRRDERETIQAAASALRKARAAISPSHSTT